jgi:hypothetical protein
MSPQNCAVLEQKVSVTLSAEDWAVVVAVIGSSLTPPNFKERVNSKIYDCVAGY